MISLEVLLAECQRGGRAEFVRAHAHPWLLLPTTDDEPGDRWRTFRTTAISVDMSETATPSPLRHRYAVAVTKTADNPWRNRISVGRARNNDIVIRDRSVSKLHAHFALDERGGTSVADAGSRNGTSVNGRRLQERENVNLKSGDSVLLGRVDLLYHDAESFAGFLVSFLS